MKWLLAALDARQSNKAFRKNAKSGHRAQRYNNLDRLTVPYSSVTREFGIPKQNIPAAIEDCLAKGFIKIQHRGGAAEHDATIYALVDDYLKWKRGVVFRTRPKEKCTKGLPRAK
jgi:hypothetical protein